jgi:hypothetical protein
MLFIISSKIRVFCQHRIGIYEPRSPIEKSYDSFCVVSETLPFILGEEQTFQIHGNSADEIITTQKGSIRRRMYDI